MNRANRAKTSSLFLLELIFAILFFSIASAVCVQIFVKAHLLSRDAQTLNLAISECTGVAELVTTSSSTDAMHSRLNLVYPDAVEESDSAICIYYDETFTPCSPAAGIYKLTLLPTLADHMLSADIWMNDLQGNTTVYELQVVHHIQREVANES